MRTLRQMLALASVASLLCWGGSQAQAQQQENPNRPNRQSGGGGGGGGGRGNFDPEQMRQRMMERYRDQLEVKDDAEWKLISERIEKVTQARRDAGSGAFGMRGGGGPGRGGDGGAGGGGRGFGGQTLPEAEALQKAIESNASKDELKAKLTKLREARKEKEAALEKAQDELRKLLSVRQEAAAVMAGLLK